MKIRFEIIATDHDDLNDIFFTIECPYPLHKGDSIVLHEFYDFDKLKEKDREWFSGCDCVKINTIYYRKQDDGEVW